MALACAYEYFISLAAPSSCMYVVCVAVFMQRVARPCVCVCVAHASVGQQVIVYVSLWVCVCVYVSADSSARVT